MNKQHYYRKILKIKINVKFGGYEKYRKDTRM